MFSTFHFAQYQWLFVLFPVIVSACLLRLWWVRGVRYTYPLGSFLRSKGYNSSHPYKMLLYLLRLLLLVILALLIARPQLIDQYSRSFYKGIDIMMVLDLSGSMQHPADEQGATTRIDMAKKEALRFIEKRPNDAIGLITFGQDVLVRCPVTHDKRVLKDIVDQLEIGMIDPRGTFLATALVTAITRLKHEKAASKIIILISDGDPTEGDMNPNTAIEIAQKMGIKVYTIGIVNAYALHPFMNLVVPVGDPEKLASHELLKRIAEKTGGMFFSAEGQGDMRAIYEKINTLEATEREEPLFTHYRDFFEPGILFASLVLTVEMILSNMIWFGL